MQESHAAFFAGQHLVVRDERWVVVQSEQFESTCLLKLRGIDRTNRDERWSALAAFEQVARASEPTRLRQGSRRAVLAAAADACAAAARWDQCWTAAGARIDLHAWQLEPAIAAVTGATRILLADAVGLGKTIQAGLIICELGARGLADRVLVLTPASIRQQWATELTSRFGLTPVVFDQATLAATAAALPPDVNPWRTAPLIIASIDLVKRAEVRTALDLAPFDVLVIDEAHHLTPDSDRGAVAAGLATRIPWVVLASATPHSGDEAAYAFLAALGAVGPEPMRVFKRARISEQLVRRRSRIFMVEPTSDERALLDATRQYARALGASRLPGARLVGSLIARRAASSAAAAEKTLSRRIALLRAHRPLEQQPVLPWDEDSVDDDVTDALVGAAGLDDAGKEIEWLERLLELARRAQPRWSKLSAIRRLLRRTNEQAIIFSEYRDVAVLAAGALAGVASVASLHGGLSARERNAAVNAFNAGGVRILVATDAAGEGLNLQQRCRLVINIELPWAPSRLEQRIGRVDRLGQSRRVHAIHLAHRSSYEGTVIARLERRRTAARRPVEIVADVADAFAATARRLASCSRHRPTGGHAVYASRGSHSSYIVLVFAFRLVDGSGSLVHADVLAVRVSAPRGRHLTRAMVRALTRTPAVCAAIDREANRRLTATQRGAGRAGAALEHRLSAVLAALAQRADGTTWQGALFDHRNERRAHRRRMQIAALREHLEQRLDAARRLQRLAVGESRLVAAWRSPR